MFGHRLLSLMLLDSWSGFGGLTIPVPGRDRKLFSTPGIALGLLLWPPKACSILQINSVANIGASDNWLSLTKIKTSASYFQPPSGCEKKEEHNGERKTSSQWSDTAVR